MTRTDIAYRKTATEGASGFGLLIALYDTLAGNLLRAAEAQRGNDLERRSCEANHAILVLGYLEDWINSGSGGELADQLLAFYASLRTKLIEAQTNRSVEMFEHQMREVLKMREIWQQMDLHKTPTVEIIPPLTSRSAGIYSDFAERSNGSWSA